MSADASANAQRAARQADLKLLVGRAAIGQVPPGAVIGIGTGSTVDAFIDALAAVPAAQRVRAAVSSSERTSARLRALGIEVLDANAVESLAVYIDGADEIDPAGRMIKGGGAALTREKIVADLAERFVCIADASKQVSTLGAFPVPIEVIPMAAAQIGRHVQALGGRPVPRAGVVTDNGGAIIDVHGWSLTDPEAMEREVNQWPGVVCVGIFALRHADAALLGTPQGIRTLTFPPSQPIGP